MLKGVNAPESLLVFDYFFPIPFVDDSVVCCKHFLPFHRFGACPRYREDYAPDTGVSRGIGKNNGHIFEVTSHLFIDNWQKKGESASGQSRRVPLVQVFE